MTNFRLGCRWLVVLPVAALLSTACKPDTVAIYNADDAALAVRLWSGGPAYRVECGDTVHVNTASGPDLPWTVTVTPPGSSHVLWSKTINPFDSVGIIRIARGGIGLLDDSSPTGPMPTCGRGNLP